MRTSIPAAHPPRHPEHPHQLPQPPRTWPTNQAQLVADSSMTCSTGKPHSWRSPGAADHPVPCPGAR
jgi:hypothetical protein